MEQAMQCCGHAFTRRRWMWSTMMASAGAMFAGCAASGRGAESSAAASAGEATAAQKLLKDNISVDVHTHAGLDRGDVEESAERRSRPEHASGRHGHRLSRRCARMPRSSGAAPTMCSPWSRQPAPGQLYQYHLERIAWMDELVARYGIRRALTAADLKAAHAAGQPAIIVDVEGLDFLELKLERLEDSYRRGVRNMQLVHYTPNDIGDFQTGAVVHNGLTPFGAEVIRACNRLGVVVDVAHATEPMVKQAAKVATRPLLLSHTALRGSKAQGPTPLTERQITPDHARVIAETGGSIGIWHFFPSPEGYVDGIKEMVDVVGVDHVSIGSDHSSSQGLFKGYGDFTPVVEAMLKGGFTPAETAKIVGGNYVRIFAASAG